MSSPSIALARELQAQTIHAKCEYFVDVHLWPLHQRLDVQGWLSNFASAELPHAVHLLNSFMYFPDHFIDQMVRRAVQQLSTEVAAPFDDYSEMRNRWENFLAGLVVTFPTDEVPNPTDSGHDFVRRVREAGVPEAQIYYPNDLLRELASGLRPTAVLFVDDLAGSGNQFRDTWLRSYPVSGGNLTFRDFHQSEPVQTFYSPIFATTVAEERLAQSCPDVRLRPVHLLGPRYSALEPTGVVWPDALAATGEAFIQTASARVGIPDTGGNTPNDWRGFGKLGLTLAFGRFVPDATLPMFYWEEGGWHPLIRRH